MAEEQICIITSTGAKKCYGTAAMRTLVTNHESCEPLGSPLVLPDEERPAVLHQELGRLLQQVESFGSDPAKLASAMQLDSESTVLTPGDRLLLSLVESLKVAQLEGNQHATVQRIVKVVRLLLLEVGYTADEAAVITIMPMADVAGAS